MIVTSFHTVTSSSYFSPSPLPSPLTRKECGIQDENFKFMDARRMKNHVRR
jgi:hypothetical protein